MAGIEKGKRDIGRQFTVDEIIIENPEINDIIQGAEFQNLIKDENFRKAVLSSDFQDIIITLMSDFQRYVALAQDFQKMIHLANTPEEMKNFLESDEFKKGFSEDFQRQFMAIPQDKLNAVFSQGFNQNDFFNDVVIAAIDSPDFGFSQNFEKTYMSQEFQESLKDIDFAHPQLANIIPEEQLKVVYMIGDDNIEAIKALYSIDIFEAVLSSEVFINLIRASDFQHQFI